MTKAFQKFDLELSRKLSTQNRVREPGPLMSQMRCAICGKAITGKTGGLLLEVSKDIITRVIAYHDDSYGPCHERKNYTDPRSLVTYRRLDMCSDGVWQQLQKSAVSSDSRSYWQVEGDFRTVLEFAERKVAKPSPEVRDIFVQHRERLKVLAAGSRMHRALVAKFMEVTPEPYGGRAKLTRFLDGMRSWKAAVFRRKDGQSFIVVERDTFFPARVRHRTLHPVPKSLVIGLKRYGAVYEQLVRCICATHCNCDLEAVATGLADSLISMGACPTRKQWDNLMQICDGLSVDCSTNDVLNSLEQAIKLMFKAKIIRRI